MAILNEKIAFETLENTFKSKLNDYQADLNVIRLVTLKYHLNGIL